MWDPLKHITTLDNLSGIKWQDIRPKKMLLETNIFIKTSNILMKTPNFPAMYM